MDFYDIRVMIEQDVKVDIHGDFFGHERVAEYIAEKFAVLVKENEELKAKLDNK